MWNIFEYPFVGIGIAIILFIILWIFRAVKPDKKRWWQLFIPLLIAIAAVAVLYFVQTDKEKIQNAISKGIKAFEQQKIEPISEIIADDYNDPYHSSKDLIIAYCQAIFQTATVQKITTFNRETKINGDKATYTVEGLVKFTEQSEIAKMGKPFMIVKARFYFQKTPQKKWLIYRSEILEIDRKPVNWGQLH